MNKGICSVGVCDRPARSYGGLCGGHDQRRRNGLPVDVPLKRRHSGELCAVSECESEATSKDYCGKHYIRWTKYGDPLVTKKIVLNLPIEERFWLFVDKNGPVSAFRPDLGECWLWTGKIDPKSGYGHCLNKRAHVVGYEVANGPVPKGLVVDHLCRVRHCVRGSHLEAKTNGENAMASGSRFPAALLKARTHCLRGHEFNKANTRMYRGSRRCRECDRLYQLSKRHRIKQEQQSRPK